MELLERIANHVNNEQLDSSQSMEVLERADIVQVDPLSSPQTMEPLERVNLIECEQALAAPDEPKQRRKRFVTKNELKRILLNQAIRMPCTLHGCKLEKARFKEQLKERDTELKQKNVALKVLKKNVMLMRDAIREFSNFIATHFPNEEIARSSKKWEELWKMQGETGDWNSQFPVVEIANSEPDDPDKELSHEKVKSPARKSNSTNTSVNSAPPSRLQNISTAPSTARATGVSTLVPNSVISVTKLRPVSRTVTQSPTINLDQNSDLHRPIIPVAKKQSFISPAQNNSFHEFARQNATAITKQPNSQLHIAGSSQNLNNRNENRKSTNHSIATKRRGSETVCPETKKIHKIDADEEVIVLSDDEEIQQKRVSHISGPGKVFLKIPQFDPVEIQRSRKLHPISLPRINIYPGLSTARLRLSRVNNRKDLMENKRIIISAEYKDKCSDQRLHILYYIRSVCESGPQKDWIHIFSGYCNKAGKTLLHFSMYKHQNWIDDTIFFVGYIEYSPGKCGAYSEYCAIELSEKDN